MFEGRYTGLIILTISLLYFATGAYAMKLEKIEGRAPDGFAEIRGVAAGAFDFATWNKGALNLVRDARHPVLEPRPGNARNIYAPSIIQTSAGWRVFYGAWDGVPTGNDRIYSALTSDFLSFTNRHTVIEHGEFQHVCNVSACPVGPSGVALICTAYPDLAGQNKPAFFFSPDGSTWNGLPEPYTATLDDIVTVTGYARYAEADINGMNVILREADKYRLYYSNFRDFGRVYRASSDDGRHFSYDGVSLEKPCMVNDVKRFELDDGPCYLMGMHSNSNQLFYALSRDGMTFDPAHDLMASRDAADRYMVAIGWVTSGSQEMKSRRLLGFLYGAGAKATLDANRIFACWLQKKVSFSDANGEIAGSCALGPDAQLIPLAPGEHEGTLTCAAEDGRTTLGITQKAGLAPGCVYRLTP